MKLSPSGSILSAVVATLLLLCLLLTHPTMTDAQSISVSPCLKNGGSTITWEEGCDARNNTYTEWCDVTESTDDLGNSTCAVTHNGCGCQLISPEGFRTGIGSGSKDCSNACVDISTDVPQDLNCTSGGTILSFIGECTDRNWTWTPQCSFKDSVNQDGNQICVIEAKSCGCLYWDQEDPTFINGLGDKDCDGCVAGGANPDMSENPNAAGATLSTYTALVAGLIVTTLLSLSSSY
jgi:hypothetical protein